ncbi:hypothetical protein CAEBREN_23837 [Caenorhabditis brenneri]|uniref:Protection of telomeres protein 1 ssDNA-binding domain-containing protein n=1 Tax=Caenorhabditis brenneri TaxID=135651 RepID=G0NB60_CAEBE|nr:hypothetical protein CAEBREN_23837 [Caenorhabditis brenneri]
MEIDLSESTLERIKEGYKFKDETYYLQWCRYMDLIAQVHSIVLTQRDVYVLRCWRGTKFGPSNRASGVESRLFRVRQEYFKQYIAPPDPRIGRAIEKMGTECLMEIVVYDEHVSSLNGIKSGDFVALKNVHGYVNFTLAHTLTLHRGDGDGRNRGISIIPKDFNQHEFIIFKEKINDILAEVTDYEDFEEFITDEQFLPRENQKGNKDGVGSNGAIKQNSSMEPVEQTVSEEEVATDTFISTVKCEDIQMVDVEDSGVANHDETPIKQEEEPSNQSLICQTLTAQ